jgi:hypothetical protein
MENFLNGEQYTQQTKRESMLRHYGERLFKCRYMSCRFRRHGFETKASRNSHEREHEKPWKCDYKGCEFENGGFLSRTMRDEHLELFHNHDDVLPNAGLGKIKETDMKIVCLDLVKANDVSGIKALAAAGRLDDKPYLYDLISAAARYASPKMLKVLLYQRNLAEWTNNLQVHRDVEWFSEKEWRVYVKQMSKLLMPEIVASSNSNMLEFILGTSSDIWKEWIDDCDKNKLNGLKGNSLSEVLAKGNDEMLDILCKWVELDIPKDEKRRYLISANMIAATTGDMYREQILLGLWRKIPSQRWTKNVWKNALRNVASTTCSMELAKFLIDQGVPVDWRHSEAVPTPLVHAARQNTTEAAELVRFFLFNGAEPVVDIVKGDTKEARRGGTVQRSQIYVSELPGARGISQWLGVNFDELVAQAEKAREESQTSGEESETSGEESETSEEEFETLEEEFLACEEGSEASEEESETSGT